MKDLPRLELTGDPNNKSNDYIIFRNSFRVKRKTGNRNKTISKGKTTKSTTSKRKKTNKWLFF